MYVVWVVSVIWLSLATVLMIYVFLQWLRLKGDPLRYETAIFSGFVFLCSFPAVLGILVASIAPRTGLSLYKRIGGIALLLFSIGILMLHDYLQAKYR